MRTERGFTLVELIVYIVVLAIGTAAILTSIMMWNGRTADHLTQIQAYNIAESVMDELNAMPMTYCDPQDTNVATANSFADCTTPQNIFGASPAGEARGDALNPFDNVLDYHGWSMSGISYIDNTSISELSNYSTAVTISASTVSGVAGYQVKVTVTPPTGNVVVLETFRTLHSPRSP